MLDTELESSRALHTCSHYTNGLKEGAAPLQSPTAAPSLGLCKARATWGCLTCTGTAPRPSSTALGTQRDRGLAGGHQEQTTEVLEGLQASHLLLGIIHVKEIQGRLSSSDSRHQRVTTCSLQPHKGFLRELTGCAQTAIQSDRAGPMGQMAGVHALEARALWGLCAHFVLCGARSSGYGVKASARPSALPC